MIKLIKKQFGERVLTLRKSQSLTQEDLAVSSEIERPQVSKIENGEVNVSLETIYKIAKALNVGLPALFDFTNQVEPKPFVKWAGGKTQLLEKLTKLLPSKINTYFEPFLGGGALFFCTQPKKAVVNDSNKDLYFAYSCFQDESDFEKLICVLDEYQDKHSKDFYYHVRELDRQSEFEKEPAYLKAARLIYLNKTCFNGLFRVNKSGYFNVPFGKKAKVNLYSLDNFLEIKKYFSNSEIKVTNLDFEKSVASANKGDFVYFDPPYDVFPNKNGFVDYNKEKFDKTEQIRLRDLTLKLTKKGVNVMLSNHNTPFIQEIYQGFNLHIVNAKRVINSNGKKRGEVEEVIITNYKCEI